MTKVSYNTFIYLRIVFISLNIIFASLKFWLTIVFR